MRKIILFIFLLTMAAGCRKLVNVGTPGDQLETGVIFSSDEKAIAALNGMYSRAMTTAGSFLNGGNTLYPALSADECTVSGNSALFLEFSNNSLESRNTFIINFYGSAYNAIYNANTLLENLPHSSQITEDTRRRLMGEAFFFRSLVYSRLVELFGPVPLVTSTNADTNAIKPRSAGGLVYGQLIKDLYAADSLLQQAGADVHPWAADALLARCLLYCGQWSAAEAMASAVINSGVYRLETSLDSVFLSGSHEVIWQLTPVTAFTNSAEGYYFLPTVDNGKPAFLLNSGLLQAFEAGDRRLVHWVGHSNAGGGVVYYYPAKYKVRDGPPYREYNVVLRLAECYLVRAEARARQMDLAGAVADINCIRARAGLPGVTGSMMQDSVLATIAQERRIELFAEWGHRWSDLKRWGQADAVLRGLPKDWQASDTLYPLPQNEFDHNPSIVQNAGYE